jgi:hypothetical protein
LLVAEFIKFVDDVVHAGLLLRDEGLSAIQDLNRQLPTRPFASQVLAANLNRVRAQPENLILRKAVVHNK